MNSTTILDHRIAESLIKKALDLSKHTVLNRFGYVGIVNANKSSDDAPDVFCLGVPTVPLFEEIRLVLLQLKDGKRGMIGDRYVINTFPGMAGVLTGSMIIIGCSPLFHAKNEAIAVVYCLYHELKKISSVEDDVFVDMLLMRVQQWDKSNKSRNEEIVPLAQAVFKPELIQ